MVAAEAAGTTSGKTGGSQRRAAGDESTSLQYILLGAGPMQGGANRRKSPAIWGNRTITRYGNCGGFASAPVLRVRSTKCKGTPWPAVFPAARALATAAALPAAALLPSLTSGGRSAEAAWKPASGIRMVVPAAPGGTTDIVARLLAAFLQQAWGQSCVVDNKSGAGGVIGSTEVAKAAPDGQTMLMGNIGPQSIAYSLYRNMPYTPKSLIAGVERHHRAQRAGGPSLGAGQDACPSSSPG